MERFLVTWQGQRILAGSTIGFTVDLRGIQGSTWNPVTNRCEMVVTVQGGPGSGFADVVPSLIPSRPPLLSAALESQSQSPSQPTAASPSPTVSARSRFNARAGHDSIRFLTVGR